MTHRVVFSKAAEKDLLDLLTYLVPQAGERIARAYIDRLIDYCAHFDTFPERGTRHDDIRPGLRTVGYRRRATIAFAIEDETVTILRVFHGGRHAILSDEDDAF
ncbi:MULTISPECIES: type II toxin-antitoxin system RelE/ParE family toxin [unclassified Mesorhizobium]|uniref:type II toxin-antitoxin system RelE/ParE family toxin n=1 Tax=unclassified Mesorhizobium TaxID=325217 RepID=UPI00112E4647|nr:MULTISPECIES: type II toxin-antitoxin system RelE/ParE family toxin [unclassified Mesorhizobium]TPJ48738.1 type II toxin-antitoxin system RelE/ParE family toxin [Mesorhizobium sp. B2-6-6]MCA0000002.1 type II toxin-antitoxin system RelE/ParE family toxin [Mesorhizobium sp. B264B2A]MCA0006053.1 type II toxin-antitoxin system RelE/ParE family toxin [Mesorhizobium sp. B264B1B]MCA0019173.1 type II toxin-antitoxin system RelE/ParE family toxin [Mesorhizobium sp. B264B1A]TPJ64529.1 type II toxin-a